MLGSPKRSIGVVMLLVRFAAIVFVMLCAIASYSDACAQGAFGLRLLNDEPLAPRGGVMMLELGAQRNGPEWPASLDVMFESGQLVTGRICWLYRTGRADAMDWTTPVDGLSVRGIEPADDSAANLGRPLLVVEVPADASGFMRAFGRDVHPQYVTVPDDPPADDLLRREMGLSAAARPDAVSPFEYWRWVLLARRMNLLPPEPIGSEIEQLIARYHADLWRLGIDRLVRADARVAEQCIELLTATCLDEDTPIAAWITDANALRTLLGILLDPRPTHQDVARHALGWAESQETLFFWIDRDRGSQVALAMVNPSNQPRLVTFRWVYGDRRFDSNEIPIAHELAPGRVERVIIERPPTVDTGVRGVIQPQLLIESGTFSRQFDLRPAVQPVRPPGVRFSPLFSVMTLSEAHAFTTRAVDPALHTTAELRRRNGRWEVFFTCFRPDGAPAHLTPHSTHLKSIDGWRNLPGQEAITLLIGPEDAPTAAISVPEIGQHRIWAGRTYANRVIVVQRSLSDRWYCRIVLPDAWVGYPLDDSCLIGVVRTHRGNKLIETGPNLCAPWIIEPGRIEVNLHAWMDLPEFEK